MLTKENDVYTLKDDSSFVKFKIQCPYAVDIATQDITNGVIFWKGILPTLPEENYCIIGAACKYDGNKCVGSELVGAEIIESNVPKSFLEVYFA